MGMGTKNTIPPLPPPPLPPISGCGGKNDRTRAVKEKKS